MDSGSDLSAAEAVALLSRTTRRAYRLVGQLAGGETGAHEVIGPTGDRLVMKWELVGRFGGKLWSSLSGYEQMRGGRSRGTTSTLGTAACSSCSTDRAARFADPKKPRT